MKLLVTLLVFLFVLLFAIVIGAQNEQVITVSFLIATQKMPVSTLIAICVVIGFVSAMLVALLWMSQLRWRLSKALKENKKLSQVKLSQ